MAERTAKQVIVMRRDLNMRKGKMVAQGSHASLGAVLLMQKHAPHPNGEEDWAENWVKPLNQWLEGAFTKICVSVDSETELMQVYSAAIKAGLPVKLITDAGHTEFHGVPTRTCLAIGPAWSDAIDPITKDLKLL